MPFKSRRRFQFPPLAASYISGVRFLFSSTARSSDRQSPGGGAVRVQVRGSLLPAQRAGTAASPAVHSKDEACRGCSSLLGARHPFSVRAETGKQFFRHCSDRDRSRSPSPEQVLGVGQAWR
uniref:Uncharacterized protein n=1 Tax=Rousettus aegyptiacus TaxID=9407 RepID=A0A7J8FJ12_ROUAE|nr:hypothetical protein HJG63_012103 [Rousettus aegyptiacus]